MIVRLSEAAREAIEAALKRGNDAIVRRKGSDVIVLEEKKKIIYNPPPNGR